MSGEVAMDLYSLGDLPRRHAAAKPDGALAIVYGDDRLSWADLERRATQRARLLQAHGVGQGDFVTIALPNGTLFHEVVFAIWKCGAVPNPVSAKLPGHEFRQIVDLVQPRVVVSEKPLGGGDIAWVAASADIGGYSAEPFDAPIAPHWKAMTSGGSTGRPKVIVDHAPGSFDVQLPAWQAAMGIEPGMVMLNPGPLYHNAPFMMTHLGLFAGCTIVGQLRFDAEEALQLIERNKVEWVNWVPTMMHRIWSLPAETRDRYDLSSLKVVWHMAAPCAPWLKEAWIHWIGGDKLYELYGGTEAIGGTAISGTEWLEKRGSVGKVPDPDKIRVIGEDGNVLGRGETGEIFFLTPGPEAMSYHYIGAEAKAREGGWQSLGDLGHIDADGYLFLADRRTDLILRGGANIYPAEIEAALGEHPEILSAVAIGLPCDAMGQRVHAIIQTRGGQDIDLGALQKFLGERMAKYKLPESYEITEANLWDDAGKVRRSALRDERIGWLEQKRPFQISPPR